MKWLDVIGFSLIGLRKVDFVLNLTFYYELAKITTPDVEPMTIKDYSGPKLTMDMSLDTERWKKYKISNP